MGLEASCKARFEGSACEGKAMLETNELLFRGGFSLRIPLREVKLVEAKRGTLTVVWPQGSAVFELGKDAQKWMLKIRYPRGRMEKLGVKEGMRVAVLGVEEPAFREELAARVTDISESRPKKQTDLIFFGVESKERLAKLKGLIAYLQPAGAIWTVYPKGQKHITQNDVMMAGKAAGLVDTKVAGFSDTHTALKWVIPVAMR